GRVHTGRVAVRPHIQKTDSTTECGATIAKVERRLRAGAAIRILAEAHEDVRVAGAEHVQVALRAGGADADLTACGDVDRGRRRAGTDAEREARAASYVADEEVRFVARYVPGLGRKAAAVVLLQAQGRRVAGGHVKVEHRS